MYKNVGNNWLKISFISWKNVSDVTNYLNIQIYVALYIDLFASFISKLIQREKTLDLKQQHLCLYISEVFLNNLRQKKMGREGGWKRVLCIVK